MRKRYAVNLKFQLKYSAMAVLPILVLGFFIISMTFNISRSVIVSQKQQLMSQISFLEQALNFLNKKETDRKTIEDLKISVRNLKALSQDLIRLNIVGWAGLNQTFLLGLGIFVIGGILLGIMISHRVAGPVFRVQRLLNEFSKNVDIPPIKVRPTDEFQELFAAIEEIRRQSVENKALRRELIDKMLERMKELGEKGSPDMSAAMKDVQNELMKLKGL
jgi:hypothetical protein